MLSYKFFFSGFVYSQCSAVGHHAEQQVYYSYGLHAVTQHYSRCLWAVLEVQRCAVGLSVLDVRASREKLLLFFLEAPQVGLLKQEADRKHKRPRFHSFIKSGSQFAAWTN